VLSFLRESRPPPSTPPSIMMVAFGDKNAMNELVYGIAIDRLVRNFILRPLIP